ncbi:MAG: holin family protein [Pseudomonadota bacterium]
MLKFLTPARGIIEAGTDAVRATLGDQAARDLAEAQAFQSVLGQYQAEFHRRPRGWFDGLVDGLNRLPRPVIAFATCALFAYAMLDPVAFTARMQGLAHVPEPLWWILGSVIGFYFGARELHHLRRFRASSAAEVRETVETIRAIEAVEPPEVTPGNPAISAWRREVGQ